MESNLLIYSFILSRKYIYKLRLFLCVDKQLVISKQAEQKLDNEAGYSWIIIGLILGIVLFFTESHVTGLTVGVVIVLLCLNSIDHSNVTESDSGTCGE